MYLRTKSIDLARWLEAAGGQWFVEGDPSLAHLPQPAPAESLVEALEARSCEIMLLAPEGCTLAEGAAFAEGAMLGMADIRKVAHEVEGHQVFQLAWVLPDGTTSDAWLLAEHLALNESGERWRMPVGPGMVEALRNALARQPPRIRTETPSRRAKKPG